VAAPLLPKRGKYLTSGTSKVSIRKAAPEDLDAIKALADGNRHELGFVRRPALAEAIDRQEVLVAHNHKELTGFAVYRHRRDTQTTLYNVVVESAYRGQGVGRTLMDALRDEARLASKQVIRLKCPADLAANCFYKSVGYQLVGKEIGKCRPLMIWELPIQSLAFSEE
jgi:N-acetylglutamate synthase-like GNAT family acetyltransferase